LSESGTRKIFTLQSVILLEDPFGRISRARLSI
jgi:hypothetical protein